MVDVLGHLGMALVWLAPSWYVFDRPRTAGLFVATTFWFGILPDVDLVLSNYFATIHHHGVFHTILVVSILAVIMGPVVGALIRTLVDNPLEGWFDSTRDAVLVGVAGVWVAGLSHLFVDMLSAPDVAPPIEPLWPLYNSSIILADIVWYTSFWATWGLFGIGIVINVALWYSQFER